jgi:antitoxin HigA-1
VFCLARQIERGAVLPSHYDAFAEFVFVNLRRGRRLLDLREREAVALLHVENRVVAIALRVSRPTLSSLLNGKADLFGDLALRIEKAFGVKMDTLMRMQSSYDIAQTRKRENQIRVPRISVLAATH